MDSLPVVMDRSVWRDVIRESTNSVLTEMTSPPSLLLDANPATPPVPPAQMLVLTTASPAHQGSTFLLLQVTAMESVSRNNSRVK
jgi:hypothetical protein